MKLPKELLSRSPAESARRLCFGLGDEASSALSRMDDPQDTEALHDFRVALRRLRSVMRAYHSELADSRVKKHRKRVSRLASSTNVARDTEVQIAWLEGELHELDDSAVKGASELLATLRARLESKTPPDGLRREFRALRRDLVKSFLTIRIDEGAPLTNFARATADRVRDHAAVLRTSLSDAHFALDTELFHQARIEAKRLRYLLEPLSAAVPEVRPLVKRMKSLQDVLGEIQDTRVLTELISRALESQAIEQAHRLRDIALRDEDIPESYNPSDSGLVELLRRQRERRARSVATLASEWLAPNCDPFFEELDRFTTLLRLWPERAFPTRRFLLSALPDGLDKQKAQLVRDGWLPGKVIRERLRSIRHGRSVRYCRLVERDDGPPLEEKLTRGGFDPLWSLTSDCRMESRHYVLPDEEGRWVVTVIPVLDVVLAVHEGDPASAMPGIFENLLARDVTHLKKFEPKTLALRATARVTEPSTSQPQAPDESSLGS